ncbi:MAG: YitT family protein [Anaerofustis stercorihominis]|nr:YitT family protein [Anaerofustis stercorihominis]
MQIKKFLTNKMIWGVLFGNILYTLTVKFFLLPADMMSSGTTGIALVVNHFTGLDISVFIFCFNVTMLIVGYFCIGKQFALTTIASSVIYPVTLGILNRAFPDIYITKDPLLSALFTGIGLGIALGIVIRSGASTGGMDIPPLVLKKYLNIPVSVSLYVFDFIIIMSQAYYHTAEDLLYGIILLIVTSVMLDKTLLFGATKTEVKIVSRHSDKIKKEILTNIDRGVTVLYGEGGYSSERYDILLSVLSNYELAKVQRIVREIDPEAFIIISHVKEVMGRGFSAEKKYISK